MEMDIGGRPMRLLVAEEILVDEYVRGKVYRRVVMDSVMDGYKECTQCEIETEELCNICQA